MTWSKRMRMSMSLNGGGQFMICFMIKRLVKLHSKAVKNRRIMKKGVMKGSHCMN